jgi:HSP20 family protein
MANLARRESIFDELFDFRRDFDGLFNRLLTGSASTGEHPMMLVASVPPIEARVDSKDQKYHLRIALPGVDPSEVKITVQGNTLTVSGEHKSDQEKKESDFLQKEFSYACFERAVMLPEGVDTEKITAEFNNGVLEITAPLSAAALPKQVEIKNLPKAKGAGA